MYISNIIYSIATHLLYNLIPRGPNHIFYLQAWGRERGLRAFLGSEILAQINNNISAIYCWCGIFQGMLKKVGFFLGRQILKLGFFWV